MIDITSPDYNTILVKIDQEMDQTIFGKVNEVNDKISMVMNKIILIDLEKVTFIDSSGLGFLLSIYNRAAAHLSDVHIIKASTEVSKILRLAGINKIMVVV